LVVPSRTAAHWKEQFGRIIIEAQACGVIVVGSNSGEIPNVIDDPARIFPEGDIAKMYDCIKSAMTLDSNARKEIRTQNFQRYSDVETAKRFSSAVLKILQTQR